jgi:hypothetical protein
VTVACRHDAWPVSGLLTHDLQLQICEANLLVLHSFSGREMVGGGTVFCNGFISRVAVRVPEIRGTAGVVDILIVAEHLVAACHDAQEPIASYGFDTLCTVDA